MDRSSRELIGDVLLNTGTSLIAVNSKVLAVSQYKFPVMPYRHVDGRKYENEFITTDIVVPFDPNNFSVARSIDSDHLWENLSREFGEKRQPK